MAQRAIVRTIPAPVGGLNDINSIADMPPTDALVMDNIFPGTNSCSLRGGSVQWVSGLGAIGETLLAYNGINSKKLFVAAGTSIIDVTTSGVAGSSVLSGKSNARWDYVNFGGNAGNHLVAVNSADLPIYYNGSTWAVSGSGFATAITGVDASLFSSVAVFKNRLYFVQKNSLKCWYLGTNSIGGAANEIDFSGVARLGGKLVAITTIPSSAGYALDDYFCAMTSEGEMLVYKGTDPASITTFALVGVYRVGRPVANGTANDGSRFICKVGADMVAITVDGFTTLQSALNNDVVAQDKNINKKIINSVTRDTAQYKQNFGWQIVLAPNNNKLLINVPTGGGEYYQYVMNTITGAWCRFTGLNASCWAYWDDQLWSVMGSSDIGNPVVGSSVYKMDVKSVSNDFESTTSYTIYDSYVWTKNSVSYAPTVSIRSVCVSGDGKYQYITIDTIGIYKSSDYGVTWTLALSNYQTSNIDCSSNGQYIVSTAGNNYAGHSSEIGLFISNDFGVTWNQQFNGIECKFPSISNDGKRIIFYYNIQYPKISDDYGVSWQTCTFTFTDIYDIKISGDGNYVYSLSGFSSAYPKKQEFGKASTVAWVNLSIPLAVDKRALAVNYDGSVLMIAGVNTLYKSIDNLNFTLIPNLPSPNFSVSDISCDASGANQVVCCLYDGNIFLSKDFGSTWTQTKEVIPSTGAIVIGSFDAIDQSSNGSIISAVGPSVSGNAKYVYVGTGA
jgi:hypothetical protein